MRPPFDPELADDEILEYDFDGKKISGRRDPPEEIYFFTSLFQKRPDTGAVIHCHPPVAVSLIATGKKIVPIHQHSIKFGKGVPVSPWLYGTYHEDGERATKAMGQSFALMMKGHGANVIGNTIQQACLNTVHLERTAKMLLWAQSVGKAQADSPRRGEEVSASRGGASDGKRFQAAALPGMEFLRTADQARRTLEYMVNLRGRFDW